MAKIRPSKIIEGFKEHLSGNDTEVSDKRMSVCLSCPLRKTKTNTCGVCGCFLPAKTKVLRESCPESKWDDVKFIPTQGIAVRLHEPEKFTLSHENGFLQITYNQPIQKNSASGQNKLVIDFINLRADVDDIHADDIVLEGLKLAHCSCFTSNSNRNHLEDGEHSVMSFLYNTALEGPFNKSIKVVAKNKQFIFKIKGEVK